MNRAISSCPAHCRGTQLLSVSSSRGQIGFPYAPFTISQSPKNVYKHTNHSYSWHLIDPTGPHLVMSGGVSLSLLQLLDSSLHLEVGIF